MAKNPATKAKQKLRIKLKAFDYRLVDLSCQNIVETAERSGAKVVGPVPLPTSRKVWCILKSPHIDKRGGEHYEILVHSRMIDILDPPPTTVDALMQLDLSSGVDIEIKLI